MNAPRFIFISLWLLLLFALGIVLGGTRVTRVSTNTAPSATSPVYSSELHTKEFFDHAYEVADGRPTPGIQSLLVAHHLLVADAMAEDFEDAVSNEVKTVVIVSPNHFGVGPSPAQVTFGEYVTPYGNVQSDSVVAQKLIAVYPKLVHSEAAFSNEHGIYALTPFVKKSFPNAKIIPIILYDSLPATEAYQLGQTIAEQLPDALLIASVDMTHYQPADYTAANDAKVLQRISDSWLCDGTVCVDNLDIDSNSSMRVLFGFNSARGATSFQLTRHDSSLGLGATGDYHENTSHILGYFTTAK